MADESGRYRIGSRHRRVAVRLHSQFKPLALIAAEVDDLFLVEGDISVKPDDDLTGMFGGLRKAGQVVLESIGIAGAGFRWAGARVPYEIQSGNTTLIDQAIGHWHAHTTVRLVQRAASDTDYVVFRSSFAGSDSEVGRRRPGQLINLTPVAGVDVIIHEIGHAVGLWHEHTRDDRDTHVEVLTQNIRSGAESNFTIHDIDGDKLGSSYDFDSIMHYPSDAFAVTGTVTLRSRNGVSFGHAVGLSAGDIKAVATMYP